MDLIMMAREMGAAIQASDEYKNFNIAREKNDNDTELQEAINNFNMKRVELNTLMASPEKDNDKINALNEELKNLYQAVMTNDNMADFSNSKNDLDVLMGKVTTILMKSVNGQDPMTCEEVDASCGSDCGTCGGCG